MPENDTVAIEVETIGVIVGKRPGIEAMEGCVQSCPLRSWCSRSEDLPFAEAPEDLVYILREDTGSQVVSQCSIVDSNLAGALIVGRAQTIQVGPWN